MLKTRLVPGIVCLALLVPPWSAQAEPVEWDKLIGVETGKLSAAEKERNDDL